MAASPNIGKYVRAAIRCGAWGHGRFNTRNHQQAKEIISQICLLVFRGLAHNPQGVLTAVEAFTLVRVESCLNVALGRFDWQQAGGKLGAAVFADAQQGTFSHDPKVSPCHPLSLRRRMGRSTPVEIKRHHYRDGHR